MTVGLPVSRLINVSVNLSPAGATFPNFNSCLILGTSTVIDVVERIREYSSITEVATDFGTSAQEYLAALLWFEQSPSPTSILIGRWANAATAGKLIGGAVSATNQLIATWNAVTTGSVKFTIDGGSEESLTGLNFSAAANLNAVAAIIDTALTGATVVYNSTYTRFEITSATTGVSSIVTFATAGASGTDISIMLAMRSTSSGAYQANGIAAESALAAVTIFENLFSSQWYGLVIPSAVDADHLLVAAFIEASTTLHFYGVTTQAAGVLSSASTSDIAYLLQQLAYNSTAVQYSSTNPYAVMSLLGRILTTNWAGNNTAITLMYKQEPGITAENLTTTQIGVVNTKNCNVFVAYNNNTAIIEQGKCSSGQFIDTVIGVDWLSAEIQSNLYTLLYGSTTKIPQTDQGIHQLSTQISAACAQGVNNGLLAPGVWTAGGFGQLKTGDFLSPGFYIFQPPLSTQSAADRAARMSPPFQVAAKLAGAVHSVDVVLSINS